MRAPDVKGQAGSAWLVPLERMLQFADQHPEKVNPAQIGSTLALWYVHGQDFYAYTDWWMIGLVTLDLVPGLPPPTREYPEARFDLMMARIERDPPVNGEGPFEVTKGLLDFQFHGIADEYAQQMTTSAVEAVCAGSLTPGDLKWREILIAIVNDYRTGKIAVRMPERPLETDWAVRGKVFTGRVES